jgi:hypothetical protein
MATNVGARGLRLLDIAYITIRMRWYGVAGLELFASF